MHIDSGNMKQKFYKPIKPGATRALTLNRIWDVEADMSYDVHPRRQGEAARVAIRTLRGRGCVRLNDGAEILLEPHSLAFFRIGDLKRYRCASGGWAFRWFEFEVSCAPELPQDTSLTLAVDETEDADYRRLLEAVQDVTRDSTLATAHFGVLYHRWISSYGMTMHPGPYQAAMNRVIRRLHDRLDGNWTVQSMAEEAGLCERRFRDVFRGHTGRTPKKFYDDLRLEQARQMLLFTADPIAAIATDLGFSSPFHLSKAYRKKFGHPPSHERN